MAIDVTPSQVATQQLQMIPFGNLIGAPLDAAIKAQATAALVSVDFIQSVGLQKNAAGQYEAIVVSFSYSDSRGMTRNLVVPLLSIVTIPYLAIDDLTIDFKANIAAESSSSSTDTSSTNFSSEANVSANYWFVKSNFKASVSTKKDSTATANSKYSVEYNMDVRVHASQSQMPAGLATVLNILNDSVVSRDPSGDILVLLPTTVIPTLNEKIRVEAIAISGMNNAIAGATITATSGKAELTVDPASKTTDATGKAVFTLEYATAVTAPTIVEVTFSTTIAGATVDQKVPITIG